MHPLTAHAQQLSLQQVMQHDPDGSAGLNPPDIVIFIYYILNYVTVFNKPYSKNMSPVVADRVLPEQYIPLTKPT
jgi:hypothetical protein